MEKQNLRKEVQKIMAVYLCKQDNRLDAVSSQEALRGYTQAGALKHMRPWTIAASHPLLSPQPQVYSVQRVTLDLGTFFFLFV